jgi:hypothetical protein
VRGIHDVNSRLFTDKSRILSDRATDNCGAAR